MSFNTGTYIRNRRIKLGLTQVQLAMLAQVSPTHLCDIEKGRHTPTQQWKSKIYAILSHKKEEAPNATIFTFAPWILAKRTAKGLSQTKFAQWLCDQGLKINQTELSKYERGLSKWPRNGRFLKLVEVLGG